MFIFSPLVSKKILVCFLHLHLRLNFLSSSSSPNIFSYPIFFSSFVFRLIQLYFREPYFFVRFPVPLALKENGGGFLLFNSTWFSDVNGGGDMWINENRFRIVRQLDEGGFTFVFLVKEIAADASSAASGGGLAKKVKDPAHLSGENDFS